MIRTGLILALASLSLSGCALAVAGSIGGVIAVDQCVEHENRFCEEVNDVVQGDGD